MDGKIGKVIAATAATSLAFEVPLPAMAEEFVAVEQAAPATPDETALEAAIQDLASGDLGTGAPAEGLAGTVRRVVTNGVGSLPQSFVNEGPAPETPSADAPQADRRPKREYPL